MGDVQIRRAAPADVESYRALRLAALRDAPTAFGGDADEEAALPAERWAARLAPQPGSATFVAEAGGELVGMMTAVQMGGAKLRHTANLYSVFVRPPWRGRAIADALLAACVAWARERGASQLKLSVAATNLRALGFYQRAGFRVYAVDPQVLLVDGRLIDELLLLLSLEGGA